MASVDDDDNRWWQQQQQIKVNEWKGKKKNKWSCKSPFYHTQGCIDWVLDRVWSCHCQEKTETTYWIAAQSSGDESFGSTNHHCTSNHQGDGGRAFVGLAFDTQQQTMKQIGLGLEKLPLNTLLAIQVWTVKWLMLTITHMHTHSHRQGPSS